MAYLVRHIAGDCGDVGEHDRRGNEFSLQQDSRILSAFRMSDGTRFWIITEADRSISTFLLPEEY